jgi:exopolyphosphatase/guanosine-5'-triphosphate,3'-diphosphate pyrophosphatase
MESKKYAAIDIGSNAIRLLIANASETKEGTHYKKTSLVRVPIRLGQDVFTTKKISKESENRLVSAMIAFRHLMKAHGIENYRACATSAMRDAKNNKEVLEEIKKGADIHIDVVTGKEEAEIIYQTHIEKILDPKRAYLYIDVGGGSTEVTFFDGTKAVASKSFNIGTIRLLNNLVQEDSWTEMQTWIKENKLNKSMQSIASGGNINRLYKMNQKKSWEPLLFSELIKTKSLINEYDFDERQVQLNMNPDRADVILHALNIYESVFKWAGIQEIHVPKMGLADGLIRLMHEKSN